MRTSLVAVALLFACGGAEPAAREPAPAPAPRAAEPATPLVAVAPETPVEPVNEPVATEPAPPPADDSFVPTAQDEIFLRQVMTFLEEMVVMMEATQDDCDRMADGLEILMRKNQALIAQSKLMEKEPKRDKWFKQQAEAKMMKVIERLLGPMQKCQSNKRVQAAFDKFGK